MKRIGVFVVLCFFVLLAIKPVGAQQAAFQATSSGAPRVFLLDAKHLQAVRQRIRDGDKSFAPALAELERDAKRALTAGPFSVVNKDATPPSGDKHDYMSLAPYWWPNPKTPNGLPYIRRDGERNPEISRISDRGNIGRMVSAVETLALAHYFTGDEKYAAKAAQLLRAWFLDPPTHMNPNFQYAQAVPGVNTGRGIGLIESVGFTQVVDAVGLLAGSTAWTDADQRGLEQWFSEFLQWMLESKNGRDEAAGKNNHGTYYDVQIASFALFLGKTELARSILDAAAQERIAAQIEPDGRQPLELARTKSWGYSTMNLRGLMSLATLGERVGVDLWNYQSADGRSIRKALDFLVPFALGEASTGSAEPRKWPHREIGRFSPQSLYPSLRLAAIKYPNGPYRALVSRIPAENPANRSRLLRPAIREQQP
jgi:hypothetical protein